MLTSNVIERGDQDMGVAENIYARLNSEAHVAAILRDPETLHLEFKQWNRDNYLEKVAIALSGLANADGGVIVFGVTDKKPRRLRPFSDPTGVAQTIHERLKNLVQRPVPNADAKAIPAETDPFKGYVAVLVPASDEAPHRCAKDREYYRRHGESFLKMDHDWIADIFGRRHHPKLRLQLQLRSERQQDPSGEYFQVYATVVMKNVGRAIARFPAIIFLEISNEWVRPNGGLYEHAGLPEWLGVDG